MPLCPDITPTEVIKSLFSAVNHAYSKSYGKNFLNLENQKQKLDFVEADRNLLSVLEKVRIADLVIFVLSANEEVDSFGEACMSCIKTQGVPNVICMVQHLENHQPKMQHSIRASLLYYMRHHFPNEEKLYSAGSPLDCTKALRHIASQHSKGINWRDRHSYLIADSLSVSPNIENEFGTLSITGYIRGNNLSANRLVHIPKFGDFQINKILSSSLKSCSSIDVDEVLDVPDPDIQDNLISENIPDPLDAEQTWPTQDELLEAEGIKIFTLRTR